MQRPNNSVPTGFSLFKVLGINGRTLNKPPNMKSFADRYRICPGKKYKHQDIDPGETWQVESKHEAHKRLDEGRERLSELQSRLYAQNEWSLLVIFQAMDAAGKDSTIKHVMSGVNPQGCQVASFKPPSTEELSHDFLWRAARALPARGNIGIFNRSYYEEVLVVRVHQKLLSHERLPKKTISGHIWKERFEDINAFETHLVRSGTRVLKFFLHVSRAEQTRRFLSRLEEPEKNWKFAAGDLTESQCWEDYMSAYEDMIAHTSTEAAPWYVVPADHKWFTRLVVADIIERTLSSLRLHYPTVNKAQKSRLNEIKRELATRLKDLEK
jgi:PPK2 family polyphosphate:nucleotide phosphotransferase